MFDFIRYRKWFYVFSLVLVLLSLLSVFVWGLNWGIDFRGGSSLYVEYEETIPSIVELRNEIEGMGFGSVEIRTVGERGVMIQTVGHIDEALRSEIMEVLEQDGDLREGSYEFETISAMISQELTGKTRQAALLSLLVILLYVSWAFRKIYRPIPSWQYGLAALVALFFDLLIMLGVFVVLGKFAGAEINIPIITALLIVFGYSVNDSVVVFDRIRENLLKGVGRDYLETVNYSLNQSLARSIKTSLTTLIVLLFLLVLGGTTLYFFSFALIVGIVSGTYSSLFIASPLLVDAYQRQLKSKK
jgi:preprotein translocase subunit SecF